MSGFDNDIDDEETQDEAQYAEDLEEDIALESARSSESLGEMCLRVMELKEAQATHMAELARVGRELRLYQEKLIPGVLSGMNTSLYRSPTTGLEIEVFNEIVGKLPKDPEKRARAFKYIRDSKSGGLIRKKYQVEFGTDSQAEQEKFEAILADNNVDGYAAVKSGETLNHAQMMKFLRDRSKEDMNIPLDAFGVHVRTFAKISLKK